MLVQSHLVPDLCLPLGDVLVVMADSLPMGQPLSVTLTLLPFYLPGVERCRHSDFLLFICCVGRPDHSLFLQQIPQQLLQVCEGTSSPRGCW